MDYKQIMNLIDSTLQGKKRGHEILPEEHQKMLMALLDYVQQTQFTGQSVLQGFATTETFPATPHDGQLCYIAYCEAGKRNVYENFSDEKGSPIVIDCTNSVAKFDVLFWNTKFWGLSIADVIRHGDFNKDFNKDFNNQ